MSDVELDSQDGYTSPLKSMLIELNELYEGLLEAGFPDPVAAMIVANMLTDAVHYRDGSVEEEDDEEDEDLDDDDGEFTT